MSNTPNQDPNSNQDPAQNYGNTPQPPYYGPPQQGPYGPPPNYPPSYPGPPQGPYGYGTNPEYDLNGPGGPGSYGSNNPNITPASTPLPLGTAIRQLPSQYIRVLTKPGAATFAAEQGKAAWNIVWVQILAVTILTVLFGFAYVNLTLPTLFNAQNLPAASLNTLRSSFSVLPFAYIVLTPLALFISLGIYHLIAKAFGGTGTFLTYMYSYFLFYVPLVIVILLLTLIPFVGSILGGLVAIYNIVLQIFMTMAVHRLRGGRATFAVLLLPIIGIVLAIVGGIVLVAVIVSTLQHVR